MTECNSVQFIADLKAQKPGTAKHFDHQMILCEADKLPFNRKLRSAILAVGVLEDSPSIGNTDQAEKYFEACEEAYEVLCRGYGVALYLAGDVADLIKVVEEKQKAAKAEFTKIEDIWLRANKVVPEPPETNGARAAGEGTRLIDTSLKPACLTMDVAPAEYRKWREGLECFFEANELHGAKHKVQNSHVKSCVNTEIGDLIGTEIADVPAFDATAGIVALIDKVYNRKHTATSKKLALFACKAKPGEKPVSFVARLNQLFIDADLISMGPDEMKRFFLISGITQSGLRTKLLEVTDPTYNKLIEKVNAWTATTETAKALDNAQQEAAKINAVRTGGAGRGGRGGGSGGRGGRGGGGSGRGGRGGGNGGRGWIEPPSSIKNTPTSMEGRCSACGSRSHMKKDCSKAATATCSTCNRCGHFNTVCMVDFYSWRDKNLRGENPRINKIGGEEYSDSEYDESSGGAGGGHPNQD